MSISFWHKLLLLTHADVLCFPAQPFTPSHSVPCLHLNLNREISGYISHTQMCQEGKVAWTLPLMSKNVHSLCICQLSSFTSFKLHTHTLEPCTFFISQLHSPFPTLTSLPLFSWLCMDFSSKTLTLLPISLYIALPFLPNLHFLIIADHSFLFLS